MAALSDIKVKLSLVQIYNDKVLDLLNDNRALNLREHTTGEVFVADLIHVSTNNLHECLEVLDFGLQQRITASQNLNSNSSRSHIILNVEVQIDFVNRESQRGNIYIADLAGCERVSKSCSRGERLDEAK